jgi:hypothetical protein
MLQLSTEDMILLVNKWVSDLARENHITPVFKGYHNGQYGSYTKSSGFYKSIRIQKMTLMSTSIMMMKMKVGCLKSLF